VENAPRPGRPRPQKHRFAFTGMIRCGSCGLRVTAEHIGSPKARIGFSTSTVVRQRNSAISATVWPSLTHQRMLSHRWPPAALSESGRGLGVKSRGIVVGEISAMPLSAWWGPIGLVLDLIGVLLLGFDLIRVQRMLRSQAAEDLANFEQMAEDYGGTESWIQDIKKGAHWVRESSYSDHHVQEEVSYNAERSMEIIKEATECMEGLAGHIASVVSLQKKQVEGNREAAQKSLRYSIIGLVFIFFGFLGQMVGTLHL
jgi:hypothetical protein